MQDFDISFPQSSTDADLKYPLKQNERVDEDALSMLFCNEIPGVLVPRHSQRNNTHTFTFEVSGLTPGVQYCAEHAFSRSGALFVMRSLTSILVDLQGYMIGPSQIELSLERTFFDQDAKPRVMCFPILERRQAVDERDYLLEVFRSLDQSDEHDRSYQREITDYLKKKDGFSLDGFLLLLRSMTLQTGSARGGKVQLRKITPLQQERAEPSAAGKGLAGEPTGEKETSAKVPFDLSAQRSVAPVSFNGMAVPVGGSFAVPSMSSDDESADDGFFGHLFGGKSKAEKKEKAEKKSKNKESKKKPKREKEVEPRKERRKRSLFGSRAEEEMAIPFGPNLMNGMTPGDEVSDMLPDPDGSAFIQHYSDRDAVIDSQNEYEEERSSDDAADGAREREDAVEDLKPVRKKKPEESRDYSREQEGEQQAWHESAGGYSSRAVDELPFAQVKRIATGEVKRIDCSPFALGRKGAVVDFYIPDELGVSRVHAFITFENGGFALSDNASGNGTFVNGERLKAGEHRMLHDGDAFSLGNEHFAFVG